MSVPATSYLALVAENAITMLAASATFQALVGAGTAAAAKAFIIQSTGGFPSEAGAGKTIATDGSTLTPTTAFACVHPPSHRTAPAGIGVYDHEGEVIVEIALPRVASNETPPDHWRRARNVAGGVRTDIEAAFGGAGCLATGWVDLDGPQLADDAGADRDCFLATITIHWYA